MILLGGPAAGANNAGSSGPRMVHSTTREGQGK